MNTQKTISNLAYGTINAVGEFIPASGSLHGAKLVANKRGVHVVALRSAQGYNIDILARKTKCGAWVDDRATVLLLGRA
jgi:hypothetical protein